MKDVFRIGPIENAKGRRNSTVSPPAHKQMVLTNTKAATSRVEN